MTTIEFDDGRIARVDGGTWSADDKDLQAFLNRQAEDADPTGSDPDPDLTQAFVALSFFPGRIIESDDPEAEDVPDDVAL